MPCEPGKHMACLPGSQGIDECSESKNTGQFKPHHVTLSNSSKDENSFQPLCCSSIVIVQPTQHCNREHLTQLVRRRSRKHWQLRNPLPKTLVGASLIKVQDIAFEKPLELLLMKDQKVIQAFSSHAPQKAFAESIGLRGSIRRSTHLDAPGRCPPCQVGPQFLG